MTIPMPMTIMTHASVLLLLAAGGDALQLSPVDGNDLRSTLEALATAHAVPVWCAEDCVTFFTVHVSGSLKRGELIVELTGNVTATAPAYVEVLGANSSLGLNSVTANGHALPLFWSGRAYSAVLPPGAFTLRGVAHPAPGPVTLLLPGPAGRVTFAVSDADVLGSGRQRGVAQATYQLAPSLGAAQASQAPPRLRLQVQRRFVLNRDKTFTVNVQASGATAGQVIALPLDAGAQVEDLNAALGHLAGDANHRRIDWVADQASPSLTFGGKWTAHGIALQSPSGTTKETWEVQCDDPYECTFSGDAEPWVGRPGHGWEPQAGQRLQVEVQQLTPHAGVQTVAQQVHLVSTPRGSALMQQVWVDWKSSTGSAVTVRLPANALVSRFEMDNQVVPLLKDAQGALQVSVPQGDSKLHAEWQLVNMSGDHWGFGWIQPPLPQLSEAVSTLYHELAVAPGRAVVLAGGLPGSPRIELWSNLGAALALGLGVLWLFARWQLPLVAPRLWLAAALGFAIQWPAAVLPWVLCLAAGRWLGSQARPRRRFWIFFELGIWGALALCAAGCALQTLEHAMFAEQPFDSTSFVTVPDAMASGPTLVWGTYVAGVADWISLPGPWMLTVPLLAVRLLWAAWAVVLALLVWHEGRAAVQQLGRYWQAATRT